MSKIKASFIMPIYNCQAYIAEAINSIVNSTEKNIELVICDDGCTDYTLDVVNFWLEKDKRIKLVKNEGNQGISKALNRATEASTGEIILPCAGDDVNDFARAEWAIKAFKKFKEADIIYWPFYKAQEKVLPENNTGEQSIQLVPFERKEAIDFDAELLKKVDGQFVAHGFCAYTRKVADTVKYREDWKYGCDHPFFLDCMKAGFKFQNIKGATQLAGTYRFHISMTSHKHRDEVVAKDTALEAEYAKKA